MRASLLLPLVVVVNAACGGAVDGGPAEPAGTTSGRLVFVVDRELDPSTRTAGPPNAIDLDESSYLRRPPEERYEVTTIDSSRVSLRPLSPHTKLGAGTLEGVLSNTHPFVHRYEIETGFAGGRFVVNGADAELTFYGSGVPIVSSERGKLVSR